MYELPSTTVARSDNGSQIPLSVFISHWQCFSDGACRKAILQQIPRTTSKSLLCGHITDESANPVSGVQISSPNFASISATTGSDGYFETEFSPLKNYDCGEPVTFTYTKSGYKTLNYVLNGPYIYTGGDLGTKLTMKKGTGSEQQVNKHGMCN